MLSMYLLGGARLRVRIPVSYEQFILLFMQPLHVFSHLARKDTRGEGRREKEVESKRERERERERRIERKIDR